jgi:hypothetical protein
MKEINQSEMRFFSIIAILMMAFLSIKGQTTMPDVLEKNTVKEQMNYLEEHTRIYENYRAIREDMFQKIKKNISDTISSTKNRITGLNYMTSSLNHKIDSLNTALETTKTELGDITRTKNSISVLGLEVNKSSYNSIMWTIVVGLSALLVLGFLVFNRNRTVTLNIKKEFQELKAEFEAYRKSSREAREKMSMDHFNELKKLKG